MLGGWPCYELVTRAGSLAAGLTAVGALRVRRWQKIPCSGLVVPTFEFRAHVAVHRHMLISITGSHVTCAKIPQDAIYTLSIERKVNTQVRVRLEDTDVPDAMIRPSSLIGWTSRYI